MGCVMSSIDGDEKYAVEQNAKIERRIRQDRRLDARTVKILLLGMCTILSSIGRMEKQLTLRSSRCGRVRKIYYHQTDEDHP